jgi:hypothetical protein
MKKNIYLLILALVLLNSNRIFAQVIQEFNNIPFGNCLSKLDSNDLIKQLRREFDSTIIHFNMKQEKIPFDFKDKWKLVYYIHTGYEEVGGISNRKDINNIYQNIELEKWLTITDIFNEFHINDTIPKNFGSEESYLENTFQINKYLDISEKYRGIWTPIISNDNYLIIRYHHWYPNGGAQSWLREYFYYFEKQKL